MTVPSGSRVPVDYGDPALPVLAVRLQEFGLIETPRVGGGAVPLTLHLLKGRYPRHHWPDDPLEAEPTSRVRRKK